MEILTIEHEDFKMLVECGKFDTIAQNAGKNVGKENLLSFYSWSDGVKRVKISENEIENNTKSDAIFFDNADYPIWIEFDSDVKDAAFGSMLRADNENFSFRHGILAGFLNYGNEIGRSEIIVDYQKDKQIKRFTFSFEVLSQKLDYHSHWKKIIHDIENEYRLLSLDYLRRTYHSFSPDVQGDTPELIWWNIFNGEQQKFINACKNIIERPRRKFTGEITYKRIDQIRRVPQNLENLLAEHRTNAAYLYCVENQIYTNDTTENRFLKHAIKTISKKYNNLKKQIENNEKVSDSFKAELQSTSKVLDRLANNPFFRTVGNFTGINQESLVLQRAFGYSQVYKTYNLLKRAYSLNDGLYRLQTKDIATLYEIWCFIEVSHIIKDQLHITDDDVEHRNRPELSGLFTWELSKGSQSKILFKKDGVELAELYYNSEQSQTIGLENLESPTTIQKPDIVLQLVKTDIPEGKKLTYLFDAKYRIDHRDKNNVDTPPEDAINQMHRYRDAIYYRNYDQNALKKEVIGGYILFPGNGERANVQVSKFYETISKVNIGAFPLRPGDVENRVLLEDFVSRLLLSPSASIIEKVITQKGTFLETGNRVLIGNVKPSPRKNYNKNFDNSCADIYYTGSSFPSTIPLQNLHYFAPFFKGKGIRDIYEITHIRTITGSEAKQSDEPGDDLRLAFHLKFHHRLADDFIKIETKMVDYTFLDTTFEIIKTLIK